MHNGSFCRYEFLVKIVEIKFRVKNLPFEYFTASNLCSVIEQKVAAVCVRNFKQSLSCILPIEKF